VSTPRPSIQHEGLVRVFRDRPALAVAFVQAMSRQPDPPPFPLEAARVTSSVIARRRYWSSPRPIARRSGLAARSSWDTPACACAHSCSDRAT